MSKHPNQSRPRSSISEERLRAALKKHNGVIRKAASELGVNRNTVSLLIGDYGIPREELDTLKSQSEGDKFLEHSERHDLDFYRNRVKELNKELSYLGKLRESVFELPEAKIQPSRWTVSAPKRSLEIPVLFTSDFQWGEVISKEELDGVNEFNLSVAKRRYRELISSTIDICKNYRRQQKYPGFMLLRGGDSISGDIHDELIQTNEAPSTMQVADLFVEEKRGIEILREEFGKVTVVSVPGNHGRLTKKPVAKKYAEWNMDHLLTLMLEKAFEGDKDIEFIHPISGDAYFPIYNERYLLTHGDRIGSRGGQGFIGPIATILRGAKKTRDAYALLGKLIDYVLVGHFHTSALLPGCVSNGALPGYGEYAASIRATPEPPAQTLFFVSSKWGLNEYRRVVLK